MLNERQKKFVREYIKTNNATQSAISAGYSKKTARVIGKENLTKPYIKEAIEKQQKKNTERFEYTVQDSFNNLKRAQEIALARKNQIGEALNNAGIENSDKYLSTSNNMSMQGNMPTPRKELASLTHGQINPEDMNIGEVNPFARTILRLPFTLGSLFLCLLS